MQNYSLLEEQATVFKLFWSLESLTFQQLLGSPLTSKLVSHIIMIKQPFAELPATAPAAKLYWMLLPGKFLWECFFGECADLLQLLLNSIDWFKANIGDHGFHHQNYGCPADPLLNQFVSVQVVKNKSVTELNHAIPLRFSCNKSP